MKRVLQLKLPLMAVIQTENGLQVTTIPEKTPIAIIEDIPPSEVRVAWGTKNGLVFRVDLEERVEYEAPSPMEARP